MVIQKQRFAIADTHAPVTATPLLAPSPQTGKVDLDLDPRLEPPSKNQILLVGYHRATRRLMSPGGPGLQHIQVSQQSLQDDGQRRTST